MNWKIRIKNKQFWLAFVPAFLLVIQTICVPFGYDFKIDGINDQLIAIVNAMFGVLSVVGIVNDPTTKGLTDSPLVMDKTEATDTPKLPVVTVKDIAEAKPAPKVTDDKIEAGNVTLNSTGVTFKENKPFIIQQATNIPDEPVEVAE